MGKMSKLTGWDDLVDEVAGKSSEQRRREAEERERPSTTQAATMAAMHALGEAAQMTAQAEITGDAVSRSNQALVDGVRREESFTPGPSSSEEVLEGELVEPSHPASDDRREVRLRDTPDSEAEGISAHPSSGMHAVTSRQRAVEARNQSELEPGFSL